MKEQMAVREKTLSITPLPLRIWRNQVGDEVGKSKGNDARGKAEFFPVRKRLPGEKRTTDGRETASGSLQGEARAGAAAGGRSPPPKPGPPLQASGGRFSAVRRPIRTVQTPTDAAKFALPDGPPPAVEDMHLSPPFCSQSRVLAHLLTSWSSAIMARRAIT